MVFRRASGTGGGYLLVNDAWFPGWHAEVDDTGTINPANKEDFYGLIRSNGSAKPAWDVLRAATAAG